MTYYADLTRCDYFGVAHVQKLLAVGWLSRTEAFPTGSTDVHAFAKLKDLLVDPWQPVSFWGRHDFELCQFDPPGSHANLFVPSGEVIFVCPALIVHYIAAHYYRPPDEFLEAVVACLDSQTMEYKKMILRSGGSKLVTALE